MTATATDLEISLVLARFDFAKVIATMAALEWRWYRAGAYYDPTEDDLRETAIRLLQSIAQTPGECGTATGGFHARKIKGEEREYLELSFEIEHSDTEHL